MNPMKVEALTVGTEVWLHVKRWDRDILEQTAVERINFSDLDGTVYGIAFENGMVQISGGYGKYWWCYEDKPEVKGLTIMEKKTSDALLRAIKRYDEKNTKQIHLKLNLKTDADILEWLSRQDSIQGYIKSLIKKDMENEKGNLTEKEGKVMKLFEGYNQEGEHIKVNLESGHVLIENVTTGEIEQWNDEYYTEEEERTIKIGLLNEGYRL